MTGSGGTANVSEWSGLPSSGTLAQIVDVSAGNTGTTQANMSTTSITTTTANDLVIATGRNSVANYVANSGPTSSFTALSSPPSGNGLAFKAAYKKGAVGPYTTYWTYTGMNGWDTATAAFRPNCSVMSGGLTPSATSCTISQDQSSCSVNLDWNITNPQSTPTAITASGMTNIDVATTTATPQSGTRSVSVPYNTRTFFLYNNSLILDQETISATCASGTAWDGTKCAIYPPHTGSISTSPNPCSITAPATTCTTYVTWTSNNVSSARVYVSINGGAEQLFSSSLSCSGTSCPYSSIQAGQSYNFILRDNGAGGTLLAQLAQPVTANVITPVSLIANPTSIFSGSSTTLTWNSSEASCTTGTPGGFNPGSLPGGNSIVYPLSTTTYSITCGGTTVTAIVTVKKRPGFIEN
jgi:hypothetical protein